jgi:hypothetical protein
MLTGLLTCSLSPRRLRTIRAAQVSGHFGSALIRGSCGASDMPLSILSGVLDRFHKAVVTASGQALPAGSGPVSGPLIDGDKSAVKGAMEGSLIKFTSDAIGYVPISRSVVDKASEAEGFVISVCDGKDTAQYSVTSFKANIKEVIPGVLSIGAGKGGRAGDVKHQTGLAAVISPVAGVTPIVQLSLAVAGGAGEVKGWQEVLTVCGLDSAWQTLDATTGGRATVAGGPTPRAAKANTYGAAEALGSSAVGRAIRMQQLASAGLARLTGAGDAGKYTGEEWSAFCVQLAGAPADAEADGVAVALALPDVWGAAGGSAPVSPLAEAITAGQELRDSLHSLLDEIPGSVIAAAAADVAAASAGITITPGVVGGLLRKAILSATAAAAATPSPKTKRILELEQQLARKSPHLGLSPAPAPTTLSGFDLLRVGGADNAAVLAQLGGVEAYSNMAKLMGYRCAGRGTVDPVLPLVGRGRARRRVCRSADGLWGCVCAE